MGYQVSLKYKVKDIFSKNQIFTPFLLLFLIYFGRRAKDFLEEGYSEGNEK